MNRAFKKSLYSRRASVYILVMGSSTLLAIMGLAALTAVRIQRKSAAYTADFAEARIYAQSAVEIGLNMINNDSNWRNTYSNGTWRSNQRIGNGTYTLEVVDPNDSDLRDSQDEPVVITGTGMKGDAKHKVKMILTSDQIGLTCLQAPLHTNGNITLSSTTAQPSTGLISCNATVNATSANVICASEAVTAITGGTYTGSRTSPITARTMPASTAFDYYNTNGTSIAFSSIPQNSGVTTIERVLISPNSNPYGATKNSQGIYVVNCSGQQIKVRNCRIFGTLYLINPAATSAIEGSVNMESATNNLPCLLVSGPMQININNNQLSENSGGSNVNLNPVGTPYNGVTDSDQSDSYPSIIKGLVYVSGALSTSSYLTIYGVLVGGSTLTASGTLDLTYDNKFYNTPPPGFDNPPQLSITPGSWQQTVD